MTVEAAVKRDIAALAKRDPKISTSGRAALALELARAMDAKNSATAKSNVAGELEKILEKLEASVPPADKKSDRIDELASQRSKRRKAS